MHHRPTRRRAESPLAPGRARPASRERRAALRCGLIVAALVATLVGVPVCRAGPGDAPPSAPVAAQSDDAWRVATRLVPPMVIDGESGLTGFSIDLWNAIARDLEVRTRFVRVDGLPELFEAVSDGRADLAVAAISITAERERRFDFSVTMFDAGLQIAVRATADSASTTTLNVLRGVLLDPALASILATIAAIVLSVAGAVWWLERRHPEGMGAQVPPARGFGHAIWWALSSLAAQAEEMPRSPLGRVIAVVWLFACIAAVTWFTAGLASTVTVDRLRGEIAGPGDLPGKRVGTIVHSNAVTYLADHFAKPVPFTTLDEACAALEAGQVAAVVYDAPAVSYYAAHAGRDRVRTVGPVFHRHAYGILFRTDDPRRKRVNRALLAMREDGRYSEIYSRWFGPDVVETQGR